MSREATALAARPGSGGAWTVTTARSLEEIEALAPAWDSLGARNVTADREYFTTVARNHPRAVRPHVVLLSCADRPVALAAGRLEDIELPLRIGYRTVAAPRLRSLTVVPGGMLGDTSRPAVERLLQELRRAIARGEADVVRLRTIESGSATHTLARGTPPWHVRDHVARPSTHWTVAIPASYDEFLRARSKSTRSNIRYYTRKLENDHAGRIELRTFHDGRDLEQLYRDTALVARKTYQHALGASFVDDRLRRAVDELSVRRGWFRAYVLYLDGGPIAFWFASAYNGVVYTGLTGYDPAQRDLRVGTYVLTKLIEEACADPAITLLDYGFGDADYKRRLGDRSFLEQDVHVFSPTAKALAVNAMRTAVAGGSAVARRMLERRGAVAWAKRRWRDRLGSSPGREA